MFDLADIVAVDTETFWAPKLKYTVRTMLPEHYTRHQLFDCFMASIADAAGEWSGHPTEYDWQRLEGKILLSHNKRFDEAVIKRLIQLGIIKYFRPRAWYCTASMTAYLFGRRALADAVEYAYQIRISKSERDDSAGKHWPQDYTAEQRANFLEYAKGDVKWCRKLFIDYGDRWPEHERAIANWHIQRGSEGVQIDRALLDQYILQTFDCKQKTQSLLPWLTDDWDEEDEFDAKPTSTKCIAEQCRRVGIPCPPVKAHEGEEAFQEWEETYGPAHPWIAALSSWRSVNKLLKTFERIKDRLLEDGTMPFGQKYCGTNTGRVSGEAQVNLFNQRKQALLIDQNGLMETDDLKINAAHKHKKNHGHWPENVKYAIDFRNLIIARPGKQLCTSDLSNIEPRCAAYVACDNAFLQLVRTLSSEKGGPYAAHAIASMGWDPNRNLKKEDPKLYDLAKARVLSLGYGASWRKLIVMARKQVGIDLTVDDPEFIEETHPFTGEKKIVSGYGATAKKVVKEYRASNAKIVDTWKMLQEGLQRSIGETFRITLPSGRKLFFDKIRADVRIEQDDEGKPYRKTVFTADIGGVRKVVYGSMLFAMTCQAFARDIAYDAVMRLEAQGICVRLMVYDEAVCELDNTAQAEQVTATMKTPPDWLPGFPLATDTKLLACYSK